MNKVFQKKKNIASNCSIGKVVKGGNSYIFLSYFYIYYDIGQRLWAGGGGGGWVRARGGSRESTKMSAHYVMPRYTLLFGARQHFLPEICLLR